MFKEIHNQYGLAARRMPGVVIHDIQHGRKSAVVIETAFCVSPETLERSCPIASIG